MKVCEKCGQEIKEDPNVNDGILLDLREGMSAAMALDISYLLKCGIKTVVFNGDIFSLYHRSMSKEEMKEVIDGLDYQTNIRNLSEKRNNENG